MHIFVGILVLLTLLSPITPRINAPEISSVIPASSAQAEEQPAPYDIKAKGVYVADAVTQEPIVSYHSDDNWSIASLTKVMTALVLMDFDPNLNQSITLEKDDFVGGATMRVPVGSKFSLRDLLHSSLMSSANNSTNALYKATGLNKEKFVERMNQKAKDMGLQNTKFVELTGLDPENKSTPEEYAKIMSQALDNPVIKDVMQTTSYQIQPLNLRYGFPIGTTNKLLNQETDYEVEGGKTGFTFGSDYNFATKVKKGEKEVVVVVFGDESLSSAISNSKKLADEAMDE